MRLDTVPYALLATTIVLAAPACGRGSNNTAIHDTRPDAAANARAASVTNDTGSPEGPATSAPTEQSGTGTAGTAGRTAPDIAAPNDDGTITMKIQSKYASDDVIKGRNIDIDSTRGVVTLNGKVETARQRDVAEQLARETAGVKRVVNHLKIATR
jgi:hyperosmotically inducible protein